MSMRDVRYLRDVLLFNVLQHICPWSSQTAWLAQCKICVEVGGKEPFWTNLKQITKVPVSKW